LCCDQADSGCQAVIHPAFVVGPLQHRMIVCCDLYDWFQQIPFGAIVVHSFYLVYSLETFVVHALDNLLFYALRIGPLAITSIVVSKTIRWRGI
jgi:hypothetical protein